MVEKHNAFIDLNCGTHFSIFNFEFKVCNTSWVMPTFGERVVLVIWKINFCIYLDVIALKNRM